MLNPKLGSMNKIQIKKTGPAKIMEDLRTYIQNNSYDVMDKLPPERLLCEKLSISRAHLREALSNMEANGEISRHVGKGTFIKILFPSDRLDRIDHLTKITTPLEIMEARILLEPRLAGLAAMNASKLEIEGIVNHMKMGIAEPDIVLSQSIGDDLHWAIARAAKNSLLLSIFETIYAVRDATNWGRLKPIKQTQSALSLQWSQHKNFVNAIVERDPPKADRLMREHLQYIVDRMRDLTYGLNE